MNKKEPKRMKVRKLIWIIPLVLFVGFILGGLRGYDVGYSEKTLNLENSMDFCESLNHPFIYSEITWGSWKWCSFSLDEIVCSSGDSCFREEGSIRLVFDNPTLDLKEIDYIDGEKYPNPFSFEENKK